MMSVATLSARRKGIRSAVCCARMTGSHRGESTGDRLLDGVLHGLDDLDGGQGAHEHGGRGCGDDLHC